MDQDIVNFIKNCEVCQCLDKTSQIRRGELQPVSFRDRPWEKLGIDIVDLFEKLQLHAGTSLPLLTITASGQKSCVHPSYLQRE